MAYQIDAADANVVLNPFVTAAAQKGIFSTVIVQLSSLLKYRCPSRTETLGLPQSTTLTKEWPKMYEGSFKTYVDKTR